MEESKKFKIFNEIMNDAFWLGYILEIKRNITDYSQKEILSSFLIFYSSIFAEETIKSNYGNLSGKRNITLEDIESFRNYNLKYYHANAETTPTTTYTVVAGDCLYKIAQKFNTSVSSIVAKNNIKNPNLIYPNQKLKI